MLLGILLLLCFACGGGEEEATPTPTPTAGYLTYTDEANGFSIWYPEDWDRDESAEGTTLFRSPRSFPCGGSAPDEFHPYVCVYYWQYPSKVDLQQEFDLLKQESEQWRGYTHISTEEMTVNGVPAIKHVFTYRLEVTSHTFKRAYVVLANERTLYIIECFCQECAWDWEGCWPNFDTIIHSFQILDSLG
ncbi:hypothetical protein ES703_01435 [subsurface metagenome]